MLIEDPAPQTNQEIDATFAGQHLRAKGYRLTDLVWPVLAAGLIYIGVMVNAHSGDSKDSAKMVAEALEKSNDTIAKVLKETGDQHAEAIRAMAVEQKRATGVLREMACLSDPAMRNKSDAREFCKRISRDQ